MPLRFVFPLCLIFAMILPAHARIIVVPDDFETIQAAVDDASQQEIDTVMLADGTYTGDGNHDVGVNRRLVLMSENGPADCIIDCEEAANSRAFFFTTSGTIIGITITRAAQNGLRVDNAQDLLIEHCIFTGNAGRVDQQSGGALSLRTCVGIVKDCIFNSNTSVWSGGAAIINTSQMTFQGCIFMQNEAVRLGGGLLVTNNSTAIVTNCIFSGNSCGIDGGGIGFSLTSRGTVSFCTFISNEAGIAEGNDNGMGGGIYKGSQSNPTIINSIFWGNTADVGNQLCAQDNGGEITISFCVVEGGPDEEGRWDGEDIIDEDPLLIEGRAPDWGVNGYFLDEGSPAIDAGSDAAEALGVDTMSTNGDLEPDTDTADLGFHYWRGWYRIVGRLFGQVLDAEDDSPLADAVVRSTQGFEAVSDEDGNWEMPEVVAGVEFDISAVKEGFNDLSLEDQLVEEGGELEIVFQLTHPEFAVEPEILSSEAGLEDTVSVAVTLINAGNGPVEWSALTRLTEEFNLDPWSSRGTIQAGEILEDDRLGGVFFDGERYFVAGADGDAPNKIYILNIDGQQIGEFNQFGTARYGMRDLAWDGELLWGPSDQAIIAFTTEGDSVTSFRGPANPTTTITWDPGSQVLWASSTTSDIFGYDTEGNQVARIGRGNVRIYGLAWRGDDPDGAPLYLFGNTPEEARPQVFKVDPDGGQAPALVQILPTPAVDRPEGAEITSLFDPYSAVMVTVINSGDGDRVELWQVDARSDWMRLDPTEGTIEGGEEVEIALTLISNGFDEGLYEAEAVFAHSALGEEIIIPIEMEVTAGPVHAIRTVNLAFGWNLISVNLDPDNPEIPDVMRELSDAGVLQYVKDVAGDFYRPANQFNNMDPWQVERAYWVKVSAPTELSVEGITVRSDDPINLQAGWNTAAYFPRAAMDPVRAFGGIVDQLTVVRDGEGHFMIPQHGFSNLGLCRPGKGYHLRMSEAAELVWGEEPGERVASIRQYISKTPQTFVSLPRSSSLMNVLLTGLPNEEIEIGVFADGSMVGSGVSSDGVCGLAVWGDDPTTDGIEGAVDGTGLTFIARANGVETPVEVKSIEGDLRFKSDGFVVAEVTFAPMPTGIALIDFHPNPFNATASVKVSLPNAGEWRIALYDLAGREAMTAFQGRISAGEHSFSLRGEGLPSGLYFIRLEGANATVTRRVVLMK